MNNKEQKPVAQQLIQAHLDHITPQWEVIDKIVACGVDVYTAMKIKQKIIDPYYSPIPIWHYTEDEMPDSDGDYLVKTGSGQIMSCVYDECYRQFGIWNEYFDPDTMAYIGRDWVELDDVEKWMNIPKEWK